MFTYCTESCRGSWHVSAGSQARFGGHASASVGCSLPGRPIWHGMTRDDGVALLVDVFRSLSTVHGVKGLDILPSGPADVAENVLLDGPGNKKTCAYMHTINSFGAFTLKHHA